MLAATTTGNPVGRPPCARRTRARPTMEASGERVGGRREVWLKVILGVCEGAVLPWSTEAWARPASPEDAGVRPFSRAWLTSLLPGERDEGAVAEAKVALAAGEAALGRGDVRKAVQSLEQVEALAPREYKLNMRAGQVLAEAYAAAGDNDARGRINRRTWWWGRGVRWPGWYIFAYLSFRSAYLTGRPAPTPPAGGGLQELAVVLPIWASLLYLLFTYGLPDP